MANQQLVEYIKTQLGAGAQKPDIQKAAAGAGWPLPEIDAAFAAVEGKPAPMPAPTAPVAKLPMQPQEKPLPVIHMHPPGGILRSWWFWTLVIILLLVAGSAAAYFYTPVGAMIQARLNPPPPAPVVEVPQPPTEQTYSNVQYGFSFKYPEGLTATSGTIASESVVSIKTSESTTTGEGFAVSVESGQTALSMCIQAPPSTSQDTISDISTTTINGVAFETFTATSTSNGVARKEVWYKGVHNGNCFALIYAMVGGLQAGMTLSQVPLSFQFIATSTPAATSTTVTP